MLKNKNRFRPGRQGRVSTRNQAHQAITDNEFWFSDNPPDLGKGFSAADANKRSTTVIGILLRAAKRAAKDDQPDLAETYYQVLDKLEACRPRRRCGSLACPRCARACQKAKVAAQEQAITARKTSPKQHLVFVTLIPKAMMYIPGEFSKINVKKANRWLKDALKPLGKRTMLGSTDLGWETRRGQGYIQLHWHLVMWTGNRKKLKKKLASIFHRTKKHERPVEVKMPDDLGFLPYLNKTIKLAEWLRRNRMELPELLLVLDQTDPIDLMIYTKMRLSAQNGRLAFTPIG